jgi:hypothetical protein
MAAMGRRNLWPLRTNSGSTSCSGLSRVSRTNRRNAADWRNRRGRPTGNGLVKIAFIVTFYRIIIAFDIKFSGG